MKYFAKRLVCMLLACAVCVLILSACVLAGHECEGLRCCMCESVERTMQIFAAFIPAALALGTVLISSSFAAANRIEFRRSAISSLFGMKTLLLI